MVIYWFCSQFGYVDSSAWFNQGELHRKNNYTCSELLVQNNYTCSNYTCSQFRALRLNLIFNVFNLPFLHIWEKRKYCKLVLSPWSHFIFSKIIWYPKQPSKLSNAAIAFLPFSHSDGFLTAVSSELFSPYIKIYINRGFRNYKSATFLSLEYQS